MIDDSQFMPPGWDDLFEDRKTDQVGESMEVDDSKAHPEGKKNSVKSNNDYVLLVMVDGRPDYSIFYKSQDEALQAQYELLTSVNEIVNGHEFATEDFAEHGGFVKVTSYNASVTIRARSVVGTYVCRVADISQGR